MEPTLGPGVHDLTWVADAHILVDAIDPIGMAGDRRVVLIGHCRRRSGLARDDRQKGRDAR